MATLTFFLKDVAVSGFGSLSLVDPGASTTNTGWAPGKTATTSAFSALLYGTERASGTFSATDYLVTTHPNPGSGDSWRTESGIRGVFANANWTLTFRVRAITSASTQLGRVKVRIWKSSSPTGASPTELTSATQTGTTTGAITTTADATSTVTWAPGSTLTFNGEYLFVQCEWEITTAGGTTTADVDFRASASTVLTSDFTPGLPTGTRYDYPVPQAPLRAESLNDWIAAWNPNLFIAPAAPPAGNYVWRPPLYTNPRAPEYHVHLRSAFGRLPPPPPLPFSQDDWPLPRAREYPIQLRTFGGALQVPASIEVPIVYVYRGPLYTTPRAPEYSVLLRSAFGRLPPAGPLAPFSQDDWPVARGYVQPIDIRTITASYNLKLIGKDAFPVGEIFIERPPLAARPSAFGFTNSINLPLNAPFPPPNVFLMGQALL